MILREPRYVFDTNVLISALLFTDSIPGRAFAHAHARGKIFVSTPLLRELQSVLSRPKFEAYERAILNLGQRRTVVTSAPSC